MIAINQDQNVRLQTIAESIAREAGALLHRLFQEPRRISHKGTYDLVTDADKAANELIRQRLLSAFPMSFVIAEEDEDTASQLKSMQENDLVWLVDPLDGTTNYAKHIPHAAVSIAAYRPREGVPLVGVVYDPWRNECFTAALGQGAYLNGQPISVSQTSEIADAVLATGFGYDKDSNADNNLVENDYFCLKSLGVRRFGAAALDLAWVAAGRFDAFWERSLKPWDLAAGMLLVSEAGGQVSTYEGGSLDPFVGHILSSNMALHEKMVTTIGQLRKQAGLPALPLPID